MHIQQNINTRAQGGDTALIMAASRGRAESVRLLLEAGADTEAKETVAFACDNVALK